MCKLLIVVLCFVANHILGIFCLKDNAIFSYDCIEGNSGKEGRFFNAFGDPIDGGPAIEGEEVEIGGPSVNPVRRKQPSELIATGIAGIDLNNTLVSGQKIPFFADPDQPFNQVMANVALRAETDKIILGGMGMTNDDYLYIKNVFSNAGALDEIRRQLGVVYPADKCD